MQKQTNKNLGVFLVKNIFYKKINFYKKYKFFSILTVLVTKIAPPRTQIEHFRRVKFFLRMTPPRTEKTMMHSISFFEFEGVQKMIKKDFRLVKLI